jgi:hypothetical protein
MSFNFMVAYLLLVMANHWAFRFPLRIRRFLKPVGETKKRREGDFFIISVVKNAPAPLWPPAADEYAVVAAKLDEY